MPRQFTEFFRKHPMQFSEHYVIKLIHKMLENAEKEHHKHPNHDGHLPHMHNAYKMLQDYFAERGIDPNTHP